MLGMKYASTIKEARKSSGLTQSELASRAGLSLATLQNIEAGKANPELATLERVLQALGMELSISHRPLQLEILIPLGLPLLGASSPNIQPHRALLVGALGGTLPPLAGLSKARREVQAITGLLWAIHDHYPAVWRDLDAGLRSWWSKQPLQRSHIKLRRMALAKLGDYL